MRFRAILEEQARKRYPLSILMYVVGVLVIPGAYLVARFGFDLTTPRWTVISIGIGLFLCCVMLGLGSIVEDMHDIMMHTVGYDLEITDLPEEEYPDEEDAEEQPAEEE